MSIHSKIYGSQGADFFNQSFHQNICLPKDFQNLNELEDDSKNFDYFSTEFRQQGSANSMPFQRRLFYGGRNPLTRPIKLNVVPGKNLFNADGQRCGESVLCCGLHKYDKTISNESDFHFSAATSRGLREANQDGFYMAEYKDDDGLRISIAAVLDGVGSCPYSEIAVSAFLQGLHTYLQYSILNKQLPNIQMLYRSGRLAMIAQNSFFNIRGNSTASIALVVGDEVYICSVGDSTLVLSRMFEDQVKAVGYTITDIDQYFKNMLSRSVLNEENPHFYNVKLLDGDVVTLATDGFWENILDSNAKFAMADRGQEWQRMNFFAPFELMLNDSLEMLNHPSAEPGQSLAKLMQSFAELNQVAYANRNALLMYSGLPGERGATRDNQTVLMYKHVKVEQRQHSEPKKSDMDLFAFKTLLNIVKK